MKKRRKMSAWKLILPIQLIASICLIYTVSKMNILPTNLLIYLSIGLIVAFVICGRLMIPFKNFGVGKHGRRTMASEVMMVVGKILSLVLSIVLLIGTIYATNTSQSIKKVASNTVTTTTYNLYVLKSDKYTKLSDLANDKIGYFDHGTSKSYDKAKAKLADALTYSVSKYTSTDALADALYDNSVEGIFVSESYGTVLKKRHPSFDNDTKILWTVTVTTSDNVATTNKDITKQAFVLFVAGVDSRGSVTKASRADVDMLITVNPTTHQILLTSIPRDSFVALANTNYQYKDKLTHACLFGTENSVKTVEHLMDIDIDFYARVGFTMITKLVDAVGGVKIYSEKTFIPWTDHGVTVKKGWQTMNGRTALAFARERHAYEEGDRHRAANQQTVIKALIKKLTSSTTYLTRYNQILSAISSTFQTNLSEEQISKLVKYQLSKSPNWEMMSTVLNGTSEKVTGGYLMPNTALYYMILDNKSITTNRQYIINMLANRKITVAKDATLEADGTDATEETSTSSSSSSNSSTSSSSSTSTTN